MWRLLIWWWSSRRLFSMWLTTIGSRTMPTRSIVAAGVAAVAQPIRSTTASRPLGNRSDRSRSSSSQLTSLFDQSPMAAMTFLLLVGLFELVVKAIEFGRRDRRSSHPPRRTATRRDIRPTARSSRPRRRPMPTCGADRAEPAVSADAENQWPCGSARASAVPACPPAAHSGRDVRRPSAVPPWCGKRIHQRQRQRKSFAQDRDKAGMLVHAAAQICRVHRLSPASCGCATSSVR